MLQYSFHSSSMCIIWPHHVTDPITNVKPREWLALIYWCNPIPFAMDAGSENKAQESFF